MCVCACVCVSVCNTTNVAYVEFNSESIRTQLASSQIIVEQGIISSPV